MRRIVVIFLLLNLIMLASNVLLDPGSLLQSVKIKSGVSDERKIANILAQGGHAWVPSAKIGFDERQTRIFFLEAQQQSPKSLIFGSSRVRYFSGTSFKEKPHFVDALNAATLEDLLVLAFVRAKNHSLPNNTLLIALDPWMIAVSNDYADWMQISIPDYFVSAVEHFGFNLPINSRKRFSNLKKTNTGKERVFKAALGKNPVKSNKGGSFTEMVSGKALETGVFPITFDASISNGKYNWAWQMKRNGEVVAEGTYMDIAYGKISPHEKRTFFVNGINLDKGDTITLEMSHANNDGETVPRGNQTYSAGNLSIAMGCSDPRSEKYSYFSRFECDLPSHNYMENVFIVLREMISPAYFQNSLKKIVLNPKAKEISRIGSCSGTKQIAGFIFCSDGSSPRPEKDSIDPAEVSRIVTTIDDGLVPLKVLDEGALTLLEELTSYFQRLNISVKYLLVPVHPYSYERWKSENDSRGFIIAEKTYKDLATKNNVPIFGSYDPKLVGCSEDDFFDWVHPLPNCVDKIVEASQAIPR